MILFFIEQQFAVIDSLRLTLVWTGVKIEQHLAWEQKILNLYHSD